MNKHKKNVQIEGRDGSYVWTLILHEIKGNGRTLLKTCVWPSLFLITLQHLASDSRKKQTKRGLPTFVKLKDNTGVMRSRKRPCVLRLHDSKKKTESHEFVYT